MTKAFSHTFYKLVMWKAAEKGLLRSQADAPADSRAGYNACGERN
jgi:hypothetical protein